MRGYRERIRPADPRLGRSINHDDQSRAYPFRAPERTILRAVQHRRHVPYYDQDFGWCTGGASVGCMATGAFYETVNNLDAAWLQPLDQAAAIECYTRATAIDPWPGQYPPEDTGSDGLSVAKVLTEAGAIAGYQHAFGLDAMLAALMNQPVITGTWWRRDMFTPTREGLVVPGGSYDGGHEYVIDEYEPTRGWVGFTNSWSNSWGLGGRFFMEVEAFSTLLGQDGDVTIFVPNTEPAPEPEPVHDPADLAMWNGDVGAWARKDSRLYRKIRAGIREWGAEKNMP